MFLFAGGCWLLFGGGFSLLLVQFLANGAGLPLGDGTLEFIFPASSGSALTGLVLITGTVTASLVCFAVSFGLLERALVPQEPCENKNDTP